MPGGQAPHHPSLNTAEVFDFVGGAAGAGGAWVPLPPMASHRCRHASLAVPSAWRGARGGAGAEAARGGLGALGDCPPLGQHHAAAPGAGVL